MEHMYIFWIVLAVTLIAAIALICRRRLARRVPYNYILLMLVTTGQSYMLSLTCGLCTPESVFSVLLLTGSAFAGMTLYALTTKYDVSIYYSIASGAIVCILTFSLVLIFTATPVVLMIWSCLGVMVGLVYVAVDARVIVHRGRYGIGCDDYI